MNFLQRMAETSGLKFAPLILDTLLLSAVVDKNRTDHSLESLGRWLGVDVPGNHTTMDDCFVTAQIFLKLLELLRVQGITTLGEVIEASTRVVEEKKSSSASLHISQIEAAADALSVGAGKPAKQWRRDA